METGPGLSARTGDHHDQDGDDGIGQAVATACSDQDYCQKQALQQARTVQQSGLIHICYFQSRFL